MRIAILSGCRYDDCGAAQRPPALARAFARLGHEVLYHNRLDTIARTDAIVKDLTHRHVSAYKLPYWGAYNGRVYPIENANVLPEQKSSRGLMCRTGKDYIAIDSAGTAYRCYMMGDPIGSILDDSIVLASGAMPCDYQCCPCQDMQQFWVREG